jgi:hypothetical protein
VRALSKGMKKPRRAHPSGVDGAPGQSVRVQAVHSIAGLPAQAAEQVNAMLADGRERQPGEAGRIAGRFPWAPPGAALCEPRVRSLIISHFRP